ncbi:MAG: DUF1553 domain-containing protein, partial [Lentisphaeraceae bacterium]|nr:DUF1553 domain-containing protein [Lentisphaeraceae bacterium]
SNDQLVASGFNRLHLIIDKGTALTEESYTKNVIDRVTAVSTAFMGLTMQCARCHDHKYDPITQKDFYAMFAFFNNIDAKPETLHARITFNGLQKPYILLGTDEQKKKFADQQTIIAKNAPLLKLLQKKLRNTKDQAQKKLLQKQIQPMNKVVQELKRLRATIPGAMVMKERTEVRPSYILNRGQYDDHGEIVERNTPEFLGSIKKEGLKSRMDLAEWFVAPENPLTARLAVNRFWQQFFGVGLVKTSEDFGAQGEVPSHPQLFDYLTVGFVESGWDIKKLIKKIVMSETYQQSSIAPSAAFKKDPENRLLSRGSRFRMDAEMIRDNILLSSGLLSNKSLGSSVKPPQPDGLWAAVTMTNERFRADLGDKIFRRSIYTFWKRAMAPPQMTILNAPSREYCVARRERTNTPLQALLLLNENEYFKAAGHLANETLKNKSLSDDEKISVIYEKITSQKLDGSELTNLKELIKDLEALYKVDVKSTKEMLVNLKIKKVNNKARLAAWTMMVNSLYNLDISKTRE